MTWWQIVGLMVAGLVSLLVIAHFIGNPKFWRLVAKQPDLALKLFTIENGCIVDVPPKSQKASYTGPFRIFTSDGTTHTVYIRDDDIDAIQARIAQALNAEYDRVPHSEIH